MRLLDIGNVKFLLILLPFLLGSCNTVDSGACGGADSNGVCLAADNIIPTYADSNTRNVDIYQDVCDPGPPQVFEIFTDHTASVILSASLIGNAPSNATRIRLTRYTVSYTLNPGSDNPALGPGIPPFQSSNFGTGQTTTIPVGTAVTVDLSLFDIQQKIDFGCAVDPGCAPTFLFYPSYTAHYTLFGEDDFGNEVWTTGATEIKIGSYDYCTT